MKVRDLVECATALEGMEIVIRENGGGKWLQGFRISKKAKLYPSDDRIENRENYTWIDDNRLIKNGQRLPDGEVVDVCRFSCMSGKGLPIKVMCIAPEKAPAQILDLEVKSYLPRNIPVIHGDRLFNNQFSLEIDCFPPQKAEKMAVVEVTEQKQLAGQMSIEDYLEEV